MRRLIASLLFTACAAGAGHGEPAFCPGEQARAGAVAARVNEEWPQRPSGDEVSRYIQALGERLGRNTGRAAIPWRFTLLRDQAPFAFAIGYGYVYVTDGTLRFARTESELAAVLAHEMGHQLAGHFCRKPKQPEGLFHRNAPVEAPVGSLSQVIDLGKEQEADRLAVGILRAADFDPGAMYSVADRLPKSAAYGHSQGDNRRLAALKEILGGKGPPKLTEPAGESFRRAKALVENER